MRALPLDSHFANSILSAPWHLPALKALLSGLVSISLYVDRELVKLKRKPEHGIHAQNQMSRLLSIVLSERPAMQEVKEAILLIANSCFHIYFAVGFGMWRALAGCVDAPRSPLIPRPRIASATPTHPYPTHTHQMDELHLGPNIVSQVEGLRARGTVDFTRFPLSQRVSYHYFVGRLKLYAHSFDEAEFHLTFAFQHTPNSLQQKRVICLYLIVASLPRGRLPRGTLLQACPSPLFADLLPCIQAGDFSQYYQCLERHQDYAISMGIYTILHERVRLYMSYLVVRKTFRLLQRLTATPSAPSPLQYGIAYFAKALSLAMGEEVDVPDAECLLVSLIEQGYVRGYLLHGRGTVVFSKVLEPFPPFYALSKRRGGGVQVSYENM
jgi:hypothetical protein